MKLDYIRVKNQLFTVATGANRWFASINEAKKFIRTELPANAIVKVAKRVRIVNDEVRIVHG